MDNFIQLPIDNGGGHDNKCWKVKNVKIDMETGRCSLGFKGWKDNDYRQSGGPSDGRLNIPLEDVRVLANFINTYIEFAFICVDDEDSELYGGRLIQVIPSGVFPSGVTPSGYCQNGDFLLDITPVNIEVPDDMII